jgi:hypothetical protein
MRRTVCIFLTILIDLRRLKDGFPHTTGTDSLAALSVGQYLVRHRPHMGFLE